MAVHRLMLSDAPRMNFYHAALSNRTVIEGRVVVDVGAGTGVLSLWSVLHGHAKHCFSFEASPLSSTLQQLAVANGAGEDRMTVIARRVEDVIEEGPDAFVARYPWLAVAGGVDVVVSEWMGFYLVHECMLPSVVAARDFFREVNALIASQRGSSGAPSVKPVRMIPDHAAIYAAPVNLDRLRAQSFEGTYNAAVNTPLSNSKELAPLNFGLLGQLEYEARMSSGVNPLVDVIPPACLLAAGKKILEWSLEAVTIAETLRLSDMSATFAFDASHYDENTQGLHGFVLWFDVSAVGTDVTGSSSPPLTLTTSPHAPPTHWKQCVLQLDPENGWRGNDILIPAGTKMRAQFAAVCEDIATRQYTLTVELGDDEEQDE
ncbi:arginine N-methyltransferase type i, putative [Bodo saltans]|uniref:Arginine N-methyltransferase type i, putative n=1 Tax=Bodo saltans TaxID=75058 RepID=A0A0S4JQD8_BODSA|nr:arginine N-methyltransferase type i, putative [Bodo saltans]|eukprot:CUG91576.1 arginine N-methyltransferase type i, putative [Bodo saltans]